MFVAASILVALVALVVLTVGGSSDESVAETNQFVIEYGATGSGTENAASVPTAEVEAAKKSAPTVSADDVGQLVISGMSGFTPSSALLARVRRGEVAGVIIMGENVNTVAQLHAAGEALREAASDGGLPAPLIMVDQEGGDVKRFRTAAPESSAASLGSGSISAARAAGRSTGNDLRNRGTNIDLAPVVDIARGSDNFLGSRVFGATNAKVTSRACAFAAGLRESRVVATLKHFPGLGGASGTNTDIAPVSIDGSSAQISKAWDPYRKCALNSGTMVMLSNATYPDAFGSRPASVNPKVYRALREDLGFKGVAITDSLAAGSLASVPHPAAAAVEAGADLALFVGEEESKGAFRDLKSAYRTGELSRERLAEAVARVRSLRKLVGDVQ